jgi:hypothetical protein
MLGRNVSGKSFVADRRINERRGEGGKKGETKGAESATLLLLVRLRRVPSHSCAADSAFIFAQQSTFSICGRETGAGTAARAIEQERSRQMNNRRAPCIARSLSIFLIAANALISLELPHARRARNPSRERPV